MKKHVAIVQLDGKQSDYFLTFNVYPGQRPLREKRVKDLDRKYETGRFRTAHVAIAHRNGATFLMNGQHQCTMLSRKNASAVDCFLEEFWCDDDNQVAMLFSQYDDGNNRSAGQVAGAYAASIGANWPKACTTVCASALAILEWGVGAADLRSKEDRAGLLPENRKSVDFVDQVLFKANKTPSFLRRVPVVAAIIGSFYASPDDAMLFWSAVRDGDMLKDKDPAFKLREYLRDPRPSKEINRNGRESARVVFVKCIHGWNAFKHGTATDLKYYSQAPIPEFAR